ncbi:hypothetical protein L218DRAFT_941179 [Marasmius fiardii PR-910]|nr:hypothetical protein L218DRAFT_941179 [Marasmius fiardii PR-910]
MQLEKEAIIPLEEDGGLFGSPPPSPGRGRSPSPPLALPNSISGVSLVSQNVGTIALPGSQHNAELAVNPLALPFSESRHGSPRPLANTTTLNEKTSSSSSRLSPMSSIGTVSRASSQTPSTSRSRKRKFVTSSSSSRPPPPQIPLPDPSQPPPSNWLRSQAALLGHAGLVGGIKPANLSHGKHRGSTPSNPIIIEDADELDSGQKSSEKSKTHHRPYHHDVFANLKLPPPPTRDIVEILIRQKEVFPILQDLLKLFSGSPGLASAYRSLNDPPPKKRKLNSVPAGAVDWDVPYPFQDGEGPQSYHDEWAQDRAKQLVSQLVALIKTASRKATLRNYLRDENPLREHLEEKRRQSQHVTAALKEFEHSEPKTHGHYKPATCFYGIDKSNVPNTTKNTAPTSPPIITRPSSSSPAANTPQSTSSIENLISSLVTSAPIGQPNAHSEVVPQQANDMDGVADSWMALFQSFSPEQHQDFPYDPLDFGSFTVPDSSDETTGSAMSTFAPSFLDSPQLMDVDSGTSTMPESSPASSLPDIDMLFNHSFTAHTASFHPNHPLSISIPQMSASGTPSLAASPIPSSFGGDFPITPMSGISNDMITGGNDFGFDLGSGTITPQSGVPDDILNAAGSLMALGRNSNGPWTRSDGLGLDNIPFDIDTDDTNLNANLNNKQSELENKNVVGIARMDVSQGQGQGDNLYYSPRSEGTDDVIVPATEEQAKNTEKDVETVKDVIPALMSAVLPMGISLGTQNVNIAPPPVGSSQVSKKALDRTELLRLAKERRAKLAEEIIKTRTQLWETTIEHGVLMHLSKFYT